MIIDPFMIQPRSSMQPSAALQPILYASSAAAPRRSSLPDLPFTYFTYFFLLIILLASCNHGNTVSGLNTSTASAARCPITRVSPNMAASKEEADLKVLVPNITSLRKFVNCSDPANVRGFCIDVFEMALAVLTRAPSLPPNFSIHYTCFNFSASPGSAGPTYNTMVELVANGVAMVECAVDAQGTALREEAIMRPLGVSPGNHVFLPRNGFGSLWNRLLEYCV